MTPIRVSFKQGNETVRGRILSFVAIGAGIGQSRVVAVVEHEQRIVLMTISELKVLKGRR